MQTKLQNIPRDAAAQAPLSVLLTESEYNALTDRMNAAMLAVYMARVGEISGAMTRKSYANCLCAYAISIDLMFSFLDARLCYRLVKNAAGRYGKDRNVTALTSCTSVGCDRRVDKSHSWSRDHAFGEDGRVQALFRELTVESAERCANALVDSVKDYLSGNIRYGLSLPFMTAVAGSMVVHDGITAQPLPSTWTGLCQFTGSDGTSRFWYLGRSLGERSFTVLKEQTAGPALLASNLIASSEMMEA